jgi:hypothetical protein
MSFWRSPDPISIVYALSAVSLIGLFLLIKASAKRIRKSQFARVASEEDGAAYTISYVMVIPCYAMLICMVIETSALLPAKIGSVYAAYAAARTATVWSTATDWDNAEKKAIAAGRHAFVPFASSTQGLRPDAISRESASYVMAHVAFSDSPAREKYLLAKFDYAQRAVHVNVDQPTNWEDDIIATVTYEFPFNIPGISRIFGDRRDDGSYYFPIESTVTLMNEAPQNDVDRSQTNTNPLGIGYGTLE